MAENQRTSSQLIGIIAQKGEGFFSNLFNNIEPGRQGYCDPANCSTLDSKKGAACCRLGYECPFLSQDLKCCIYGFRFCFPNCPKFPRTRKDLEKVANCSYSWPNHNQQEQA